MNIQLSTLFLFLSICFTHAQNTNKNFYSEIGNYDISKIINAASFSNYEEPEVIIQRPEPIGYIGEDYQRFYIHFTKIERSVKNPYEYTIEGKTMVKNNIRSFKGTLSVTQSEIFKNIDLPNVWEGYALCKAEFKEDSKLSATGVFKGELKVKFIWDQKKGIEYNSLSSYADSFHNNQFKGTWTSFKTHQSKKVRFGDFRIPDSGNLDMGAGEFSPDPKYWDKGWKYYILNLAGETEKDYELGKKMEKRQWWK
ncbi:hypothetical protein VUJ46_02095 [Chryseobacterium sp. MYb264]|uniref:hypothetical protein n=1 Tax=Chryseobacterium sp. MYb264 TaxID=2745153 RepID=UPI002E149CC1|nr:hypothetical protein VUJ46_02095 [Chryseobacterium sp. MYb264]